MIPLVRGSNTNTHTRTQAHQHGLHTTNTWGTKSTQTGEYNCDRPVQQVVKICYGKKVTTRNSGRSEAIQRSLKEQKH